MKLKQRKPRSKSTKSKEYFGEKEEASVKFFLTSTNEAEKNKVFEESIAPALRELVKGVSSMPKFQKIIGVTKEELYDEAYYHVVLQLHKYKPGSVSAKTGEETKAYSYYGTVVKNFFLKRKQELDKQVAEYGLDLDIDEIQEQVFIEETDPFEFEITRKKIQEQIETFLSSKKLTEHDIVVGNSLKYMLANWHKIEFSTRNQFIRLLNQYCQLPPELVARSLNKFKQFFYIPKVAIKKKKSIFKIKKLEEKLKDAATLMNEL